jgi:general secretion pathway protein A
MYTQFYGLREIPFTLAPNPRFLFRTESLLEGLASLQYGIESGRGMVVVTGEVGTGKTTILRAMLDSLDRSVLAAYIFNPLLSTEEFFSLLTNEFRLRPQPSKADTLRTLGGLLISRHGSGQRTVLLIDEAHLLPKHLLEEVRLLSNFETNSDKLLQIVLCGQPELKEVLAQPEMRHFRQRISLRCTIKPLTQRETADYITWRLRIAGAKDPAIFEPDAVRLVGQYSFGIPRVINSICDNALLSGFSNSSPRITAPIVKEVLRDLDLLTTEVGFTTSYFGMEDPVSLDPLELGDDWPTPLPDPSHQQPERKPAEPLNVRYIRREEVRSAAAAHAAAPRSAAAGASVDSPRRIFSRWGV